MMLRIGSAWLVSCLLLGGQATADEAPAATAEAASAAPTPDFTLRQVQLQGVSTMPRERKTLAQIFKAQALFEQHRRLAPQATLRYRVYARQYAEDLPRADLALLEEGRARTPIPLDGMQRFTADPAWRELDQETEVRSRLADGRVTWRPDIRTPGWPEGEARLGDLRLQCRVAFDSGLARTDSGWVRTLSSLFGASDACERADWSPSNFAERPIFSVTLVHGERRLRLNQRNLHGLFDEQGERYDWGFLLRDRMYRVPLGDRTWPDDTRVLFEYMDAPSASVHEGLQQSSHPFAAAARSLKPGLSEAHEAQAIMGQVKVKILRFDSGMQIWRYWQAAPKAAGAKPPLSPKTGDLPADIPPLAASAAQASPMWAERGTELVLLLDAQGRLQKLAFKERL